MADHPDKVFAVRIVQGIANGFRVDFEPGIAVEGWEYAVSKGLSEIVAHYLVDELKAGRIAVAGTTRETQGLEIHCSPFGIIPKENKPGKFHLILNLSAPENHSVNDGINKELASLSYVTVDEVAETVQRLSRGTLMAKMDIRQAYRNIPVHPLDRRLLGMLWKDKVYIDTTLLFVLRSAPLIFMAIADAEQWIMQ